MHVSMCPPTTKATSLITYVAESYFRSFDEQIYLSMLNSTKPLFMAVVNKMQCSVGYFHLALPETVLQRLPKIKTVLKSKRTTVWKTVGLAS